MTTQVVRLAGKSGYCCKIFIQHRHVATVANPDRMSREGALEAAHAWDRTWRKKLRIK